MELTQSDVAKKVVAKISFSKLSKEEKINYIVENYLSRNSDEQITLVKTLKEYWHTRVNIQQIFDEFSENTLTNFYLPFGVVPNFILNGKDICIPMVIEESSVVAASARSAKFWSTRGGFHSKTISMLKVGQVHMIWPGDKTQLQTLFDRHKHDLLNSIDVLQLSMQKRGGGLHQLSLRFCDEEIENYVQLFATFETCDAMGANFINTILEALGREFKLIVEEESNSKIDIIMAILSNYTPECLVTSYVTCPVLELADATIPFAPQEFAERIKMAIKISQCDVYRATTHNKGIFNGIDAVVLATGNDFRAVEACGHAWAAKSGRYLGLTNCFIEDDQFTLELTIPMSLGTVGGLTSLHPLAKFSLDLLNRPNASELMQIACSAGLAQNFAALRSLVTTGIQRGHMKMHLINILKHLEATDVERVQAKEYFNDRVVSYSAVRELLMQIRQYH